MRHLRGLQYVDVDEEYRWMRSLFCEALSGIEEEGREPTMWEARCLFAALMAMVAGDAVQARQLVGCVRMIVASPPWLQVTDFRIADLRAALDLVDGDQPESSRGVSRGATAKKAVGASDEAIESDFACNLR